jgi:hypothetical protein
LRRAACVVRHDFAKCPDFCGLCRRAAMRNTCKLFAELSFNLPESGPPSPVLRCIPVAYQSIIC